MKLPVSFKFFSLLFFAAGVGGFFGAYLATESITPLPPPVITAPVMDNPRLEAISAKLETIAKQFAELNENYQTLVTNGQKQATDFSQFQETLFAKLQLLENKLETLNATNVQSTIQTPPTSPAESSILNQSVVQQVDYQGVQEALKNMRSPDLNTRQRALQALILLGSTEIKQQIGEILLNEEEDVALRRNLIQNMDWQGFGDQLVKLFENSKNSVIRAATVSAVDSSRLSETEKQVFETSLIKNFNEESDEFIKIVTLDYFSNQNSPHLQDLINNLNQQNTSQKLQDHIKFLTTPAM